MSKTISNRLISSLKPSDKPYEVRDIKLKGFIVRVQPSGKMSYICEYKRGARITIGDVNIFTPIQARDEARKILADVARNIDPRDNRRTKQSLTFWQFITDEYGPWLRVRIKGGEKEIARLKMNFSEFKNKKINEITAWNVEKWRKKKLESGKSPSTVNRDLAPLKTALSRATDWGFLKENPLKSVKPSKVDRNLVIRYLSKEEESQLRQSLKRRDTKIRTQRLSANEWRRQRHKKLIHNYENDKFVDHLEPMVLLSLNTGLRQGELFGLEWENINFDEKYLTVSGSKAKSKVTRHIPLNKEALSILTDWSSQKKKKGGLLFPSRDGKPFLTIKKSWMQVLNKANITKFRWHDLRHTFASNLVMAGVDLNTVRELLGHADLTMTLRYAHLAPEHKAEAVAKLVI